MHARVAPALQASATRAPASRYFRPTSVDDALTLMATYDVAPLAGGTELMVDGGAPSPALAWLDLSRLSALDGLAIVSTPTSQLRVGACTTWRALASDPLPPGFEAIEMAAAAMGSLQVQQRATLGGNLCGAAPTADGIPPLLALDAQVVLASSAGVRRMPLSAFVVGDRRTARRRDELLTAVEVPFRSPRAASRFLKLGGRNRVERPIATVAVALDFDARDRVVHCGIAVGACSPTPRRLPLLEATLRQVGRTGLATTLARQLDPRAARALVCAPLHLGNPTPLDAVHADVVVTMIRRAVDDLARLPGAA